MNKIKKIKKKKKMDGSGTRNEVEELGDFAVKRGSLNRLHGSEK